VILVMKSFGRSRYRVQLVSSAFRKETVNIYNLLLEYVLISLSLNSLEEFRR